PFAKAETFQTGSNRWLSYDAWPPKDAVRRDLYIRENGSLSFTAPPATGDDACDAYVSDPANPVPYRPRPILPTYQGPGWATWLLDDQGFVERRPDVVSWRSEPLATDLSVTGDIVARRCAHTTGTDSDWVVTLIGAYAGENPEDSSMAGYELMIAGEVLRGRFRNGFEQPQPVKPGEVAEYTIDLNPQTFVPNIFLARAED